MGSTDCENVVRVGRERHLHNRIAVGEEGLVAVPEVEAPDLRHQQGQGLTLHCRQWTDSWESPDQSQKQDGGVEQLLTLLRSECCLINPNTEGLYCTLTMVWGAV